MSLLLSFNNARLPDPILNPISSPTSISNQSISPIFAATVEVVSPGMKNNHHLNKRILIALIVVSCVLCAILSTLFFLWICRLKKSQKSDSKSVQRSDTVRALSLGTISGKFNSIRKITKKGSVSVIEFQYLEAATDHFSESNILGEGGFGCVYKACFDNDFLAAVKKIDVGGQDAEREFEKEVDLLNRIRHPNIISLLGYCIHDGTRFIIYELIQNGSLETQLHGPSHGSALTWHIRMKIALDTARALEYLHENCNPPVIHRDLKSSNILLDSNFNAKISDFGLAVISGSQNKNNIKLSGTLGYVAPEYLLDGTTLTYNVLQIQSIKRCII
ncbi:kinase domain [Thalictrum thalictroides]|uniref:non-specific serine/threonine protein kinase n=1 Tax=Thalictrum thalictroides TaxID=46969 RepID=A0A7J6X221_THATH|nr:kinase domain [Thalictrum thalictroides]